MHLVAFALAGSFSSVSAKQAAEWEVGDSCSVLTHMGESKLWGQKCSIVLQNMNLRPGGSLRSPPAPLSAM